jgi:hypothetical protein
LLSCRAFLGEVECDDITFGTVLVISTTPSLHFTPLLFPPTIPSSLRRVQVHFGPPHRPHAYTFCIGQPDCSAASSTSVFPNIQNLTDLCSFHRPPHHISRYTNMVPLFNLPPACFLQVALQLGAVVHYVCPTPTSFYPHTDLML